MLPETAITSMNIWFIALTGSFIVSFASLSGAFSLFIERSTLQKILPYLLALATGVLLGGSFLHLLPHSLENGTSHQSTGITTIAGILAFFLLERFFRNQGNEHHALGKLILIGDGFHNFIDGLLIAATVAADTQMGMISIIAILVHEIPQEIGDVGTLIYSGYTPKKAILYNYLSSLTAPVGTLTGLLFINFASSLIFIMIPVAAGGFIYIALSDLLPVLQSRSGNIFTHFKYILFIILGVTVMEAVHHFEQFGTH
jgi:zinc and cadmium transporter